MTRRHTTAKSTTRAGEGVIGKFPVLTPGAPEFVYQSCTAPSNEGGPGSMEGFFRCGLHVL